MATHETTPQEVDNCQCLLRGAAKNLADRLYGPQGPPWGTSFADLERIALRLALALRSHFLHLVLSRQAATFLAAPPPTQCLCPSCQRATRAADPEPRILHSLAGDAEWSEPQRYCPKCRKAFFPQSQSLGLDLGHYSASLLDLICYVGANNHSFRQASLDLDKIGNVRVSEKQVERLSKRIGSERLAQRDAQLAHFLALPLTQRCDGRPAGVQTPGDDQVAVLMADAGMLQLREPAQPAAVGTPDESSADAQTPTTSGATDPAAAADRLAGPGEPSSLAAGEPLAGDPNALEDDPDQDKPPSGRHWHEDKVGLVLTMHSTVGPSDPCPEVPATFLDPQRVATIVRGLKKSAALQQDEAAADAAGAATAETAAAVEYEGPKVVQRRVVASRQSWPLFGALLAAAAWQAGFAKAQRKAFVADGARAIWRVWRTRFSSYVPILDFIHALSYVYAAAQAMGADAVGGWKLYAQWITWVWRGQVSAVIEQLQQWQQNHGQPEKGEGETSPRRVVHKTLGYLSNNQDKMKYAAYRQQGLPIVSSLVESMVKQIGRRVKGTEKFWAEEGAEAILQLRADYLSDGEVMEQFWQRRQGAATGQRCYRVAK